VVAEVVTEMGVDEGVLSGGNWGSVLFLLKLGDGLVDETKESFRSWEIGGWRADVVSGGLWDNGGVGQWVDQQDTRRNGIGIPWVLEDRRKEDGGLGGSDGSEEGGIVIPNGQGGAWLGGRRVVMSPSLGGQPKEVFNGLTSSLDVELVDVVKIRPGGDRGSGRGHFRRQSASIRDCSSVRNSLLMGSKTRRWRGVEGD